MLAFPELLSEVRVNVLGHIDLAPAYPTTDQQEEGMSFAKAEELDDDNENEPL